MIDKSIYSLFTADGDSLVMEHGWTNLYVCGIGLINTIAADGRSAFARTAIAGMCGRSPRSDAKGQRRCSGGNSIEFVSSISLSIGMPGFDTVTIAVPSTTTATPLRGPRASAGCT